ncbi:hypothetical protein G7Y79_00029g063980 [Physcia stellaris]|nr:hypothetical protein G7Y79_00029g063980 [Physcia stellaris]
MSQLEIYEEYAQPVKFKNRVDWHMRPREETVSKPHDDCCPSSKATLEVGVATTLDLYLLRSSREAHREAGRLLYSSNKWLFDDVSAFRDWLAAVPPVFLPLVQHVGLQMAMSGDLANVNSSVATWKTILCDTLPSSAFTSIFRPLRRLRQIEEFTVVMKPDGGSDCFGLQKLHPDWCGQPLHDHDSHVASDGSHEYSMNKKARFWERTEARRVWAEEIRAMVLRTE